LLATIRNRCGRLACFAIASDREKSRAEALRELKLALHSAVDTDGDFAWLTAAADF
jgi:hypothetical protein